MIGFDRSSGSDNASGKPAEMDKVELRSPPDSVPSRVAVGRGSIRCDDAERQSCVQSEPYLLEVTLTINLEEALEARYVSFGTIR